MTLPLSGQISFYDIQTELEDNGNDKRKRKQSKSVSLTFVLGCSTFGRLSLDGCYFFFGSRKLRKSNYAQRCLPFFLSFSLRLRIGHWKGWQVLALLVCNKVN